MKELLKRHIVLEKILNDEEITLEDEKVLIDMYDWISSLIIREIKKSEN